MSRGKQEVGCIPEASSNADAATLASGLALPSNRRLELTAQGLGLIRDMFEMTPFQREWDRKRIGRTFTSAECDTFAAVLDQARAVLTIVAANTPTASDGAGYGTPSTTDASQALWDEHQTATGEKG